MAKQLVFGMFSSVPEAQFITETMGEPETIEEDNVTSGKETLANGTIER